MCRLVIAVIFISFVSCVLAEMEPPDAKPPCWNLPQVKASKENLRKCFNNTVAVHLKLKTVPAGECKTVTEFSESLNEYLNLVKTLCDQKNLMYNTTDIIKLVEFSLREESFKKFYDDLSCVKTLEDDISNTCVKHNVGFFNITKERKHTTWYRKANLRYISQTCTVNKDVKNCVDGFLKTCGNDSRMYVESLFEFSRQLADCTRLESEAVTIPPPSGNAKKDSSALDECNGIQARPRRTQLYPEEDILLHTFWGGAAPVADSWLTTPVIIILSVGTVVVAVAIIVILLLKFKIISRVNHPT